MGIKGKAPDLGILESRAALGVRHIFGRNSDVGNLRGGKTARDIEARRSSSEFHLWNRDGAVVAEEDIAGEPRHSGKDRGAPGCPRRRNRPPPPATKTSASDRDQKCVSCWILPRQARQRNPP